MTGGGEAIGVATNVLEKSSLEEANRVITENFDGTCDIMKKELLSYLM